MTFWDIRILSSLKLGYWFHQFSVFAATGAAGKDTNFLKSGYRDIGPPGAGPLYSTVGGSRPLSERKNKQGI